MIDRRTFLRGCLQTAAASIAYRSSLGKEKQQLVAQIDESLARALRFLENKQYADGSWHSEVYGPLKDGLSLTPFIAASLSSDLGNTAEQPLARAIDYLALDVRPDGSIDDGREITYPVYAAAGSIIALTRQPRHRAARDAWMAYLCQHQLVEHLGWQESNDSFGGWSFSHHPPRPVNGQPPSPMAVPNLSATVMAVDAIRAAGCPANDPAIQKALKFVMRCQNWADKPTERDSRFDDGGFFFLHDDPTRNKAGEAGVDAQMRTRYVSYGSTTADGLCALLKSGLPNSDDRVQAAQRWLVQNFSGDAHPGAYSADREHLRPALFYYYCASAAEALRLSQAGCSDWPASLAFELLSRQGADGSWSNPAVDVREDDPLVATPLAIRALLNCKSVLPPS